MEDSYFKAAAGKQLHQNCSTLILPAVSLGNVGQLAVDLLVANSSAERVGFLDDPYVLPCVGNDPYSAQTQQQGLLALPLEVYDDPEDSLSIIQQRSPVTKGMLVNFSRNISSWAATSGKKEVIILSSLDSGRMQQYDKISREIHYMSSTNDGGIDRRCEELGWKKIDTYFPSQRGWQYLETQLLDSASSNLVLEEDDLTDDDYLPSLPFASLFCSCKAKGLEVICLFCFCSEGDNVHEAFVLAEAAHRLLAQGKADENWVIPLSWHSVYGPPPDLSIF